MGTFEGLIDNMRGIAEDMTDPSSSKTALAFLGRCVYVWNRTDPTKQQREGVLPGFEGVIYERLLPAAFRIPSHPNFNIKDGQVLVVSTNSPFSTVYILKTFI